MPTSTQPETLLSPKQQEHAAAMRQLVQTAITDLARQIGAGHTDGYLDMLAFYRKFWRYSARNLVLIKCQQPDATRVAGYHTWQKLGWQVAKGSTAIWIWCPIIAKGRDPETGAQEEACLGFRPGSVFDAADLEDIETDPLPTRCRPLPNDCEDAYWRVLRAIGDTGLAITEQALPGGLQGKATADAIVVSSRIPDSRNRLATLLHEYAHCLAHFGPVAQGKDERQCELEAESACYVVLTHLGIDYPFSRDYLLHYKVTPDLLYQSLAAVQGIVRRMMRAVEGAKEGREQAA